MRFTTRSGLLTGVLLASASCSDASGPAVPVMRHVQGEMAGEVTAESVILQTRVTSAEREANGDVTGQPGGARFEIAKTMDFKDAIATDWIEAHATTDFVVRARVSELDPGVRYFYRAHVGATARHETAGPIRSFETLPGPDVEVGTRFVAVTGMHYDRFRDSPAGKGADGALGFPALAAIKKLEPDFFIGTGDNVYYDYLPPATTEREMRKKWHEQFVQPRFVELFSTVATYWQKDDHDYRFDDADPSRDRDPSDALGRRIFLEQAPIFAPDDAPAPSYRTHRVSKLLQIWLLEGRDHRSPNADPDGPTKTLWGAEQKTWLRETLMASDADFKLIISPTPMVGPDDERKSDNHTNPDGFRQEGEAFFGWAASQGLRDRGLTIICGDRHWQYHSVHPSGFEEMSVGALVDGNARLGTKPGEGSDPNGLVVQPYTSPEASGGFLLVQITPKEGTERAKITFDFLDEQGSKLYSVSRDSWKP